MIKGKTPEEIRKLFNIVNDFTPEEEVCQLSARFTYLHLLMNGPIPGPDQEGERELSEIEYADHYSQSIQEWAEDR